MKGAGSLSRKYNFCKTTSSNFPLFCLFDFKPPEPPPPQPVPSYTFYYNKTDLINMKLPTNYDTDSLNSLNYIKYQQSNLYNKNFSKALGSIFYDITISNSSANGIFDLQKSYLSINEGMLTFTIALYNKSETGYLKEGIYVFDITGATNQLVGSKGYIKFIVNKDLRKLEVYLN